MDPRRALRQAGVDLGAELGERMAAREVVKHDRLVPDEPAGVLDQVVDVQVTVHGALAPMPLPEESAFEQDDAALRDARRALPEARTGVPAVGEPDLLGLDLHALAAQSQRLDLGARERRELRPELATPPQEMEAEARDDMVGRERLERQVAAEFDAIPGSERDDLEPVVDALEPSGGGGEAREVALDPARAIDRRRRRVVDRALREQVGKAQRVVEVPVREENEARPGELRRAAPGVEGEPRRVDAEPGLLAGDRAALDRELAVPERVDGAGAKFPRRRQISE